MKFSLNWPDAVALALAMRGGQAHLNRMYDDAPRIYGKRPATFDSIVRDTLESHSSDSQNFNGGKDLFTSALGLGEGIWALRGFDWLVGDVISEGGQWYLAAQAFQVYPSHFKGHPLDGVRTKNFIEFAQQTLPKLPLWKSAS